MSRNHCDLIDRVVLARPRKSCGPLAQLLRSWRDRDTPRITVCNGGLRIGARGQLWHEDCPSTLAGAVPVATTPKEALA